MAPSRLETLETVALDFFGGGEDSTAEEEEEGGEATTIGDVAEVPFDAGGGVCCCCGCDDDFSLRARADAGPPLDFRKGVVVVVES